MVNLYADEGFPRRTVEELRRLGHDVLTMQEVGRAGQAMPDEVVLADAIERQRAVLTENRRHFILLHRQAGGQHFGIIVCKVDVDRIRQAARIDSAVREAGDISGRLIRINRG